MSGYYDIHCHILPEVDDGADSMEMARKMLQQEYEDGVRVIYATPHYKVGVFETSKQKILQQYELVKEYAGQIGDGLEIQLGCEFHVNMDMIDILSQRSDVLMGESPCVLTEFSEKHDFQFIKERCYILLSHGYQPIIAHIERYPALTRDLERIRFMKDMGVYLQINADSILGKNGFFVQRFCKKIMEYDFLHFVGSDAHDLSKRKSHMGLCIKYVRKKMGQDYAEKLFRDNPHKLMKRGREK